VIKALMLGSGFSEMKRRYTHTDTQVDEWTSLDMNPDCNPDVLFELNTIEQGATLPFENNTFDEIHAYEVLEHYGTQGDYKGFFRGMKELWRILKPNGFLFGTCPLWNVMWSWGDPGHCRVITYGTLSYLCHDMYEDLGKTAATDYSRYIDPCWWEVAHMEEKKEIGGLCFVLRKVK